MNSIKCNLQYIYAPVEQIVTQIRDTELSYSEMD